MPGFDNLMREYEAQRFPPGRQLDVHAEGPTSARDRALRWIQSFAHEEPGSELLLIVERGGRPGARIGPVRQSVETMLDELVGTLVAWWQPFATGSLAVRISADPRMLPHPLDERPTDPRDEGRTPETASPALLRPDADIPEELLPTARRAAELRREREGLSTGLLEMLLGRIWIEAQAVAMDERISFQRALERIVGAEEVAAYEDE